MGVNFEIDDVTIGGQKYRAHRKPTSLIVSELLALETLSRSNVMPKKNVQGINSYETFVQLMSKVVPYNGRKGSKIYLISAVQIGRFFLS